MSGRLNYQRAAERQRIHQRGSESVSGGSTPPGVPKIRMSKAELRAEIDEATARATRLVECLHCGHQAAVTIPMAQRGRALRCSQCGEVAA